MPAPLQLPRFSIGVGDRFAHQARAQLAACVLAANAGVDVIPVWNKSNREHTLIGSEPTTTRAAADAAVRELGWTRPHFVDADHITVHTVERFLEPCDFFTIDVAEQIGKPAASDEIDAFIARHQDLLGKHDLPGIATPLAIRAEDLRSAATKYLGATIAAGEVYRLIAGRKGSGTFVPEISMDETDAPQTPAELFLILAAIADQGIPIQTIAPKFTGRFNKGVDYVGDLARFARELTEDLAVIAFAVHRFGLPANLKLSVHSGSDKFSLYPVLHQAIARTGAGLHLKTAGTTWLEELIGLAESGGDGLRLAQEIYREALAHLPELTAPYATVIDIDPASLPSADEVHSWSGEHFAAVLRHVPGDPRFNPGFRQLLHVAFKLAARLGSRYTDALERNEAAIARNVTSNLFDRHIRPVFLGN